MRIICEPLVNECKPDLNRFPVAEVNPIDSYSGYTLRIKILLTQVRCAMGYAELINRLESLPREKQAEVFDFVEFLASRSSTTTDKPHTHTDWTDAEFSELSMHQSLRGMEDECVTYTRADLREQWQ
jgi:hypothetical protein